MRAVFFISLLSIWAFSVQGSTPHRLTPTSLSNASLPALPEEELPKEFFVKYNALQSPSVFFLDSLQELPFAKVLKEEGPLFLSLSFRDLSEKVLATAQGACEKAETKLTVFDPNETKLGTILRKKTQIAPATYQVLGMGDRVIAEGQMNWLGTRFILSDPNNTHLAFATFYRPYFNMWGDYWYVQIHRQDSLDPRLIVMIATLQTYIDRKNCEIKP